MGVIVGSIIFALALLWSGDRAHKGNVDAERSPCEVTTSDCQDDAASSR